MKLLNGGECMYKTDPEFIIFTGPMFGSKTTRLLAQLDRFAYQNRNIVAYKPVMDNRYSNIEICTHSGGKFPAHGVSTGDDIMQHLATLDTNVDVVAVDESFERWSELLEDAFPRFGRGPMPGAPSAGEESAVDAGSIKGLALAFLTKGMLDGSPGDKIGVNLKGQLANSKLVDTENMQGMMQPPQQQPE